MGKKKEMGAAQAVMLLYFMFSFIAVTFSCIT